VPRSLGLIYCSGAIFTVTAMASTAHGGGAALGAWAGAVSPLRTIGLASNGGVFRVAIGNTGCEINALMQDHWRRQTRACLQSLAITT
jgi:hypothetical protein